MLSLLKTTWIKILHPDKSVDRYHHYHQHHHLPMDFSVNLIILIILPNFAIPTVIILEE